MEATTSTHDEPCVLAIDQGTTNTKVLLVGAATGRVVSAASAAVGIRFPRPQWVEQSAEDVWDSVLTAAGRCLDGVSAPRIAAISVANQRESVAIWRGSTGASLGPVLGWQDARTAAACAALIDHADTVRALSGLGLDPMFSAPKMRWLLDHAAREHPDVPADDIRVGTIDTFLVHRLTGQFLTEAGNASRTMLMDLRTCTWSDKLIDLFGIPAGVLAPIRPSSADYGRTVGHESIPAGVPVRAVLADSHSALYLHTAGRAGEGKVTYGTGSSIMVNTDRGCDAAPDSSGIATTLAWYDDAPTYASEGNILASGAALSWAADLLTGGDIAALTELARQVGSAEVAFVPAFSGLGAPWFDRAATGILTGITAATTANHLAKAAFEAVAHQVADVIEAVEAGADASIRTVHADGGASGSTLLMQLQADLLGRPLQVSAVPEASALGAAQLAARSLGLLGSDDTWTAVANATSVQPQLDPARRQRSREQWACAVARSRGLAIKDGKDNA